MRPPRPLADVSSRKADFLGGVRDVAPALPANVPFGIIAGVASAGVGMSPLQTVVMAATLFAGAAHIAAVDLMGRNAPLAIVVLTALVVNLRYMMYSASIAPYFKQFAARWKAALAYFLLDVDYALSVTKFAENEGIDRRAYYLGTALPIWMAWVASTAVGAVLGASVPASWQLDFAIPLLFLSLLVPNIKGRASGLAAVASGLVAVIAAGLPFNLGLIVGAVVGIVAGMVVEGRIR